MRQKPYDAADNGRWGLGVRPYRYVAAISIAARLRAPLVGMAARRLQLAQHDRVVAGRQLPAGLQLPAALLQFGSKCEHETEEAIANRRYLEVGDVIRMASPDSPIPPPLRVVSIEPDRALVTHVEGENPVSWVWVLDAVDADTTRLIVRFRQDWEPSS
jgi:hypothetical protein